MYQHTAPFFQKDLSSDNLHDDKPSAPPLVLPHHYDGTASCVKSVDGKIPSVIGHHGPHPDLVVVPADGLAFSSLPSLRQAQLHFARKSLPTTTASKYPSSPSTPIQNSINPRPLLEVILIFMNMIMLPTALIVVILVVLNQTLFFN